MRPTSSEAPARTPLHALVWLLWACCGLAVLQAVRTPPAVLLVIGVSVLVVRACAPADGLARAYPLLVGLAAGFAVLRVGLTVVTTHGGDDVLLALPAVRLPALLGGFTVGGTLHRAVLLRSATESLVVVAVIAVLAAFNAVVSRHELLRFVPRAFHELALVVGVAVAFVPSTLASVTAVRESDQARTGLPRVRGRWARRLGAVLEGAMERAVLLSESMESRGFGHRAAAHQVRAGGRLALGGLFAAAGGVGALLAGGRAAAVAAAAVAVAAITTGVALVSRGRPATGLARRRLARTDVVVAAAALLAAAGAVLVGAAGGGTHWDVHAQPWPPLPAAIVPLVLLLAAPAVVALRRQAP